MGQARRYGLRKLCEAEGKVLLLGAPLNTLTILHHAEAIARGYRTSGKGSMGRVGAGEFYLFDAAQLVEFAVKWLEERLGKESHGTG